MRENSGFRTLFGNARGKVLKKLLRPTWKSSKLSTFSPSFIAFSKSTYNFEYFEKTITFIASACPKLFLLKNVVTSMPLNSFFRTPFRNQRVKMPKTKLKAARQHFYANFILKSNKLSCLWCLLVRSEMLGLLFNTLTTAHVHSCHNWEKVRPQLQTAISPKPSIFSENFMEFAKST